MGTPWKNDDDDDDDRKPDVAAALDDISSGGILQNVIFRTNQLLRVPFKLTKSMIHVYSWHDL